MSFSAKVILDSVNPYTGIRLVTSELTYPRFIHAEFMTHRMFSRNAASSRAIPTRKMIDMVDSNPAKPVYWGKNKKGMAATQKISGNDVNEAKRQWALAKDLMVCTAKELSRLKVHKQITNRVLEPWKYITVICTATQFSNFFALRDHEDAQPEIAHLARLWKTSLDESTPTERRWHIPYIQDDEQGLSRNKKCKIGVARCARVSYLTHDGRRDIEADLTLYSRLLEGSGHGHWSPFEHVASATDRYEDRYNFVTDKTERRPIWCGNFQSWVQFRKIHAGECQ
jgi:thymidylate synthase ThyX